MRARRREAAEVATLLRRRKARVDPAVAEGVDFAHSASSSSMSSPPRALRGSRYATRAATRVAAAGVSARLASAATARLTLLGAELSRRALVARRASARFAARIAPKTADSRRRADVAAFAIFCLAPVAWAYRTALGASKLRWLIVLCSFVCVACFGGFFDIFFFGI